MYKLYYSPGACSLAPHIVLKELGVPHEAICVPTGDEAHRRPEFLKINPLGRLPALALETGVLTEVPAIMLYLAERHDSARLIPQALEQRARLWELLSLIASSIHPAYAMVIRPDRVVSDEVAHAGLQSSGRARFEALLAHVEKHVFTQTSGDWVLPERYTVADPYLFVMYMWARYAGVDARPFERMTAWVRRVRARPAIEAALRAEGLIDAEGRPQPPQRV